MANLDLTKYGITGATVIAHNPSYEQLFEEETKCGLEGYEVGQEIHACCNLPVEQRGVGVIVHGTVLQERSCERRRAAFQK